MIRLPTILHQVDLCDLLTIEYPIILNGYNFHRKGEPMRLIYRDYSLFYISQLPNARTALVKTTSAPLQ